MNCKKKLLQKSYIYFLIGLLIISSSGITLHFHHCRTEGLQFAFIFETNQCNHVHNDQIENSGCCAKEGYHCTLNSLHSDKCCNKNDKNNTSKQPEIKSLCCSEYSEFYSIEDIYQNKNQNQFNPKYIYYILIKFFDENEELINHKLQKQPLEIHLDFQDFLISYIHKTFRTTNNDISDFNIC